MHIDIVTAERAQIVKLQSAQDPRQVEVDIK